MSLVRVVAVCAPAMAVLLVAPGTAKPLQPAPVRFVTDGAGATDYWPCFSPDGRRILFTRSFDGGKKWELYVVPAAGGAARPFASPLPVSATRPNWSWRHDVVAFTGIGDDGRSEVWIIDSAGVKPARIQATGLSDRVLYPGWYPDGRRLVVLDAGAEALKRIDRRGGVAVRLTDPRRVSTGMARVSPDGRWIAFAGQANTGGTHEGRKNSIWLIDESGVPRPLERVPAQGRTPAWSPDGRWLAFQSNRGSSDDSHAAFVVKRDGTGLRRVTGYDIDANHPDWSPDGKSLVFAARRAKGDVATAIAVIRLAE